MKVFRYIPLLPDFFQLPESLIQFGGFFADRSGPQDCFPESTLQELHYCGHLMYRNRTIQQTVLLTNLMNNN